MLNNISNFFSLVKGKRVKKTLAPNDMIAIGVRNPVDRADYQPAGIFFKDLEAQVEGLQTVSVDNVTITGDGTPANPLTAIGGGPVVDTNGNLIIADSSNDTVSVGFGDSHLVDNFSGMILVNDHYDGGVETWICGGGDCVMLNHTSAAPGNSTFTMNGQGYEWTNVDNLNGPFTFTVIKTRSGS